MIALSPVLHLRQLVTSVACRRVSLVLFACLAVPAQAQHAAVRVTNPSALSRKSEVLDLPMSEVKAHLHSDSGPLSVRVVGTPTDLLTQVYASQIDGPADRLLVLIDLAPKQSVVLELNRVDPSPHLTSRVQARNVPERMDDFAWENDRVAYRVYGPALQATGRDSLRYRRVVEACSGFRDEDLVRA